MTQEPNIFPYIARLLQGAEVVWKPLGEVCEFSNTGVDKKTIEGEKKVRLLNFVDVFHKQYITKETPTMIVSASDKKNPRLQYSQRRCFYYSFLRNS